MKKQATGHILQKYPSPAPENQKRLCPYCGRPAPLVWVHGHGQCTACGINTNECCSGEQCLPALSRHNLQADETEKKI